MQPLIEHASALIVYDSLTGKFAWKKSHGRKKAGSEAGTLMHTGYIRININKNSYAAHRLAWLMYYGVEPDGFIDHANGDRSDNRIANLRLATREQNAWNANQYKNNRTGLKGVHYNSRDKRYIAQITKSGKRICLGSFTDKHEAHSAYTRAADLLHGEFSSTKRKNPR